MKRTVLKLIKANNSSHNSVSTLLQHVRQSNQSMIHQAAPPWFPLAAHHFRAIGNYNQEEGYCTPDAFHSHLCQAVLNAKERVKLATLYIGAANGLFTQMKLKNASSNIVNVNNNNFNEELQFLISLSKCKAPEQTILMDYNRALRTVKIQHTKLDNLDRPFTNSAKEVCNALYENNSLSLESNIVSKIDKNIFLFPMIQKHVMKLNSLISIPSIIHEVMGVFHLKIYIVDDTLILSGANLSQEYFSTRQDRYTLFVNGGNGLVDFYSKIIDILAQFSIPYNHTMESSIKSSSTSPHLYEHLQNFSQKKIDLLSSITSLYREYDDLLETKNKASYEQQNILAYAIPTLQIPFQWSKTSFPDINQKSTPNLKKQNTVLPFISDVEITRNLLENALKIYPNTYSTIYLSSAYLNPTQNLISILQKFHRVHLLTASKDSHGFAPKPKSDGVNISKGIHLIPLLFTNISRNILSILGQASTKLWWYDRKEWTFHGKGLWLSIGENRGNDTRTHNEHIGLINHEHLVATVVGSSNFGARSETLDMESNCVLILNDIGENKNDQDSSANNNDVDRVKKMLVQDWNGLMINHHVKPAKFENTGNKSKQLTEYSVSYLTKIFRKYL